LLNSVQPTRIFFKANKMKIVRLIIKNFRSIGLGRDGNGISIDLEDNNLVFLIGKNNAGKSSILAAYEMFVMADMKATERDFFDKKESNEIVIEAHIKAENDADLQYKALSTWWDQEKKIAKIKKTWSSIESKGNKASFNPEKNDWEKGGAGGFDTLLQHACPSCVWIKGMDSPEEVLKQIQSLVKEMIISNLQEKSPDVYQNAVLAVNKLQDEIENNDYTSQIKVRLNNVLQTIFPDVFCQLKNEGEPDFVGVLEKLTNVEICQESKPNLKLSCYGHGTQRQFILSAFRGLSEQFFEIKKSKKQRKTENFLLESEINQALDSKSKMLLFEEPELFLHPEAMRSIIEILYSLAEDSEFQIMVATHAPIMVDLSKPHTTLVRVINAQNKGTQSLQVSSRLFDEDERDRILMLNRFNPYVCEAFFSDRVILVEGDTETIVIRTLLEKFKIASILKPSEYLHVVNCGSKTNIPFFQKVLRHFEIPYYVFHDCDDKTDKRGYDNPSWKMNDKIWQEMEDKQSKAMNIRRFVFMPHFEKAHGYQAKGNKDKPFSAYQKAKAWNINDNNKPVIKYLRAIFGQEEVKETFSPEKLKELYNNYSNSSSNHANDQGKLF